MSDRVSLPQQHPAAHRAAVRFSVAADEAASDAGLDPGLVELVKYRVSQLNGCAFCLRSHALAAIGQGETLDRLAVVGAWRETAMFSPEERAAFVIAESITRIADREFDGVEHASALGLLGPERASAVSWVAIAINALTRVAVTSGYPVE